MNLGGPFREHHLDASYFQCSLKFFVIVTADSLLPAIIHGMLFSVS